MPTPDILSLPPHLARHLRGATLHPVTIGRSGAGVYRVLAAGAPVCSLKVAGGPARDELIAERERLSWLRGRLAVPDVLACAHDDERTYLLLTQVPGVMACDAALTEDIPALVRLLAGGLRQIHQLDITSCPFDMRLDRRIAGAERRMRAGLVDAADFDEIRSGVPLAALFEHLLRDRPASEDLVFTHGDFCLPNVLIDRAQQRVSGFVDWSRAGMADRFQDLALAARSLTDNFGPGYEPLLWDAYGLAQPDAGKLAYYQLLDEFF